MTRIGRIIEIMQLPGFGDVSENRRTTNGKEIYEKGRDVGLYCTL